MTSSSPPTYLGMVLCDNILKDPETNKHYLLGTATQTWARQFPARYGKMCIYAVLTGIHGSASLNLKVVQTDNEGGADKELMNMPGQIQAPDPLAVAELTLSIRNLLFSKPGQYRFQLWSESTLLGERRFLVKQAGQQPPGESSGGQPPESPPPAA